MAFKIEQLKRFGQIHLPTAKRNANFFIHATEDAAATVAAAGYFNGARHKLKVGDTIVSKAGIGATEVLQFLDVTAVPGSGNVTTEVGEPGIVGGQTAIADVSAAAAATAGGSSPTAAQVDTGIATAVAPLEAGINDILAALRAAGILDT